MAANSTGFLGGDWLCHMQAIRAEFDKLIGQQRAPSWGQEDTGLKAIAESVSRCDLCQSPAGLLLARERSGGPRHGAIGGRVIGTG